MPYSKMHIILYWCRFRFMSMCGWKTEKCYGRLSIIQLSSAFIGNVDWNAKIKSDDKKKREIKMRKNGSEKKKMCWLFVRNVIWQFYCSNSCWNFSRAIYLNNIRDILLFFMAFDNLCGTFIDVHAILLSLAVISMRRTRIVNVIFFDIN